MLQVTPALTLRARRRRAVPIDLADPARAEQVRIAIAVAVTRVFGVEDGALWSNERGVHVKSSARQTAMYLAHVCCGMTLTEVGLMFGRDRTTVSHGCLQVEVRRDDPVFDRALDLLTWALPSLVLRNETAHQTQNAIS